MFLGQFLVGVASMSNYLTMVLPPKQKDPPGIFDKTLDEVYDYIVVGAGSAGSIVATRLSEGKHSVLLLEAGGSELENDLIQIPLMWVALEHSDIDWKYKTVPQNYSHHAMKDNISRWPRGKVLGGTGSINAMGYVRGNPNDFDCWEIEGATGWSYKDVLPFFKTMENITFQTLYNNIEDGVCDSETCYDIRGRDGPLSIKESTMTNLEFLHEQATKELALQTINCNGDSQIGFCRFETNIKNGERCDSAACYLRPVINRLNLHVSLYSHVTKVIIEDGTASGIRFIKDGIEREVYARKEIILSAGVVGTPHILLLSGVGPMQHLNAMNIPVRADLPVGEHLQDHMSMFFQFSINMTLSVNGQKITDNNAILKYLFHRQGIYAEIGADGMVFVNLNQCSNKDIPDIQLIFLGVAYERGSIEGNTINYKDEVVEEHVKRADENSFQVLMNLLHPRSRGTIRLSSNDPNIHPSIDPQYLSESEDVETFLKGIRFLQKLQRSNAWQSIGATLVRHDTPGHCSEDIYDGDDYWRCMIRHFAQKGNHQTSSCRIGSVNDKTAVVDPQLRVKGIKNLRIADASVMRKVPSGNTNAATMMIAEKASHIIRQS